MVKALLRQNPARCRRFAVLLLPPLWSPIYGKLTSQAPPTFPFRSPISSSGWIRHHRSSLPRLETLLDALKGAKSLRRLCLPLFAKITVVLVWAGLPRSFCLGCFRGRRRS